MLDFLDLPSIKKNLTEIGEDLLAGISVCIVLASPYEVESLLTKIDKYIAENGYIQTQRIDLRDLKIINKSNLQKYLHSDQSDSLSWENLILHPDTNEIVFLTNVGEIKEHQFKELMLFMEEWANKNNALETRKSLCCIVPGDIVHFFRDLPTSLNLLKIRVLGGIPSTIEMQLLHRLERTGASITPKDYWNELLISSLAGNDSEFAYFLGTSNLDTFKNILNAISEFQDIIVGQRVLEAIPTNWNPIGRGENLEFPRDQINIKLLHHQQTILTPEHGEELHSLIVFQENNIDELKRRVWRSQASLVLPALDELRNILFNVIGEKFFQTLDITKIPELGQIKYCLDQEPPTSSLRKKYYNIVKNAVDVRNDISHLELIEYYKYNSIVHDIKFLQQ